MTVISIIVTFLGGIIVLGSLIWLILMAVREGFCHDVLLLILGLTILAYIVARWRQAIRPIGAAFAGLLMAGIGAHLYTPRSQAEQAYVELFNRAESLAKSGDLDAAIAHFSKAINVSPTRPEAYCNRGLAWFNKGEYGKAIADHGQGD